MALTGELLKKQLGLNKFKIVRIQRSIDCPIPFYRVFVDSRRPNFPLTNSLVNNTPLGDIYNGNQLPKESSYTPLMDLDMFNPTTLNGRIFIVIDLAGKNLIDNKMHENLLKGFNNQLYIYGNIYNLLEGSGFTIDDFKKNATSQLTKKHFKIRQSDGDQGTLLEEINWNEEKDTLWLKFFVMPTFDKQVPIMTKDGGEETDNHYIVEIIFDEVKQFLGTKKEFLELSKKDQIIKIRKLIKEGETRIWSDDFSWWWQGGFENSDKLNYNIYPFPGPNGKGIWSKRHKGESPAIYITKHMIEVLQILPAIADEIVKEIK